MTLSAQTLSLLLGASAFVVALLLLAAFSEKSDALGKRLARVSGDPVKRIHSGKGPAEANSFRSNKDSTIPVIDRLVKLLPNPDKLRARLAGTGQNVSLGEYALMNALAVLFLYMLFNMTSLDKILVLLLSFSLGLLVPHAVTGFMKARRLRKFLASFPEAIDTLCRGIRSGLPITESINAVGREMPDPIGIEFHRIGDNVRMGKSLEDSMWDVAQRVDTPEFRFLIIAMAIQKETGGNLAETLENLSDLIRKRRQLRLKVKAMSSEAKASALIIGSLPFIMFGLLSVVNRDYVQVLFDDPKGLFLLGGGIFWMSLGWGVMLKMIHFEL
ncbi:MAG: type II secretion system F family protein [Alphaproteobacteria bacterium]|nr:type II secretion system F family protein [Alphaproteobacteria bacterium]